MTITWEKCVHAGIIDPMRFVAITSSNAAKLFNIYPKKGRIAVDSDADLVLWDENLRRRLSCKTHYSAADFTIFEGQCVHGTPIMTISQGKISYENGSINAEQGTGSFCQLVPRGSHLFGIVQQREKLLSSESVDRTGGAKSIDDQQHQNGNARSASRGSLASDGASDATMPPRVKQPPGGKTSMMW